MTGIVIKESDGSFRTEPSRANIIQTENGVYVAYDIDAARDDYKFLSGAEILGTYYGDLELISEPDGEDTWLSEAEETFTQMRKLN